MRPVRITQTGVGSTAPVPLDFRNLADVSLQVVVSGSATWTVEQTLDDPFNPPVGGLTWFAHADPDMVAQTVNRQSNYAKVPRAVRLTVTSGAGSAALTVVQSTLGRGC